MTDSSSPLSPAELEILDRFLSSPATADDAMMVDTLNGYLTAIVLGPVTLPASRWLPNVWGGKGDAPAFRDAAQAEQITHLIERHMNAILEQLATAPEQFAPILDQVSYPNDEREYADGEMWCYGFLAGIGLARDDWQPLFEHEMAMDALQPIYTLGARDHTPAQRAMVKTPALREKLAQRIPASVATLYRFWLPYREALAERGRAVTFQRDHPKVGRNDPCPCGSGKKFKKCCGAAAELH